MAEGKPPAPPVDLSKYVTKEAAGIVVHGLSVDYITDQS